MSRSYFKKEPRAKKEELKYPCSPRSQKWINNLLPVLESYNYNYLDVIKLVKGCDYNADKIQIEVERVMQMKVGHEQGEWELVKPNSKSEKNPAKSHAATHASYSSNGKIKGKTPAKEERPKRSAKTSPKARVEPKPEKAESEDEKKELFTSWASLLKRDPATSSSSLNSGSLSSNLAASANVGASAVPTLTQGVDALPSLTEQPRLNEQSRLNDQARMNDQNRVADRLKTRPPVVMPKEFDFSECRFTFGCLEEELWAKPWPDWRPFQKPRSTRLGDRGQSEVFPNYYERKAFYFDDPKKFDRFHVGNTSNLQPVASNSTLGPLNSGSNLGPVSSNASNLPSGAMGSGNLASTNMPSGTMPSTNMPSTTIAPGTMPSTNMGPGKEGVYFTYPYSNDRLQNPPGLVSYYTPQPFYAFGNNNNNVTSMWQN